VFDNWGQRLGAHAIAALVLLITASALIWIGVAFAGYALYLALLSRVAQPWAAALAGAILVAGPIGWALIMELRTGRPRLHHPEPQLAKAEPENATVAMLAKVAQEKPLLALVCAGILGASEAILRRKDIDD
jgi:hypothetical protein